MSFSELKYLIVDHTLHAEPLISAWLWALTDTRRRTNGYLEHLSPDVIDWQRAGSQQTIGTILYHIALIEADWLYTEVLEQPYPAHIAALLPESARDEQGALTHIHGVGLAEHQRRLAIVRDEVLNVYRAMDIHDFYRVRQLADYDVTPEWVLHHLMQHEAEHRSELVALRDSALLHGS